MSFERVLVVGAGQMGAGIAQVVAASGRKVLLHDAVPVNAVPARDRERAVRELVHADGARGGPKNLERLVRQAEPPVRTHDRIARALDLRERGQQVRRDDGRRVALE